MSFPSLSQLTKRFEKPMRIDANSTVWIRPDQIESIVKRNCPGDASVARQLLSDWHEDVVHGVVFCWHTRCTGYFYDNVGGNRFQLCDSEVIRCEL